MNHMRSHGPSLQSLGYRIAPVDSDVAVVAAKGDYPLYPWEIITQHRKLGSMMRDWCIERFGWTVERREACATTLFYRAFTTGFPGCRVDMVDHWNRIHSFIARGSGEHSVAYSGQEKFIPHYLELANTVPRELTRVKKGDAEIAMDTFMVMAMQFGMRRYLAPREKNT